MSECMPERRRFAPAHAMNAGPQRLSSHSRHSLSIPSLPGALFEPPQPMRNKSSQVKSSQVKSSQVKFEPPQPMRNKRQVKTHFWMSHRMLSTQHSLHPTVMLNVLSIQDDARARPPKTAFMPQAVASLVMLALVVQ